MLINIICEHLTQRTINGELSNNDLVQIIELAGSYLNIKTLPDYARENNMSYHGVKKHRTVVTIFNTKFVIDND